MFSPLPAPTEMAAWDRAAIGLGIPEIVLMENAAREATRALRDHVPDLAGKRVLVFMGGGNNGGDAAGVARHLQDNGADVLVVHTNMLDTYSGAAGQEVCIARACGVPFRHVEAWQGSCPDPAWPGPDIVPDVVVDGLLGTGITGALRPLESDLVSRINAFAGRARIVALDVPSGLDALSGYPRPVAVRADHTFAFAAAKPGLVLPHAAAYVGRLVVCDIGMPARVREEQAYSYRLMESGLLDGFAPGCGMHKGSAGQVVVLGGSPGLTGAPHLAALGALRAGAGLVSVAAPGQLVDRIKAGSPDIMTHDLGPEWSGELVAAGMASLAVRAGALVCGPGLGRGRWAAEVVRALLSLPDRPPVVVDADALTAIAHDPSLLGLLRAADVLTPHPGEAAALLGHAQAAEVQNDRFAALRSLVALAPSVWVLKGAGTLVGQQGQVSAICPIDAPNLAVGGSGDVLSGCIGALIARRLGREDRSGSPGMLAACAGVMLHANAGLKLAERFPRRGNTASDIADALPLAWLPA